MTNKVELSGKVYNSELRTTASGKTIIRFGLSIWAGKDKAGNSQYQFVNCKYWGDGIENGMNIDIVGKICFDTWEKDGQTKVRQYVLIDSFSNHVNQPKQDPNQSELEGW